MRTSDTGLLNEDSLDSLESLRLKEYFSRMMTYDFPRPFDIYFEYELNKDAPIEIKMIRERDAKYDLACKLMDATKEGKLYKIKWEVKERNIDTWADVTTVTILLSVTEI